MRKLSLLAAVGLAFATTGAVAGGEFDFGKFRDRELETFSPALFGVFGPLHESSTKSIDKATAEANPAALATVAKSLKVRVLTSGVAAPNVDMIALWPDDKAPTHLIFCNEEGPSQPGVQRLRLADSKVETILTGTDACDPVRRTAWGTILVGEEAGNSGQVLEIINPIGTTGVWFDRVAGTFSGGVGAGNIATRHAVGRLSFEGIALYPNGVMYYGDENRPATGTGGGAYFKFVPATPRTSSAPISNLSESPLVAGKVYGLRLGKRSGNTDYGQGSNTGLGTWIEVVNANNADLRAAAATLKLTGYYRPEDIDIDRRALADGKVRFCGNNTGNEGDDRNWGESICITDGTLADAVANVATPEVLLFVVGTPELAMMDNMAYNPQRGFWILHEDGDSPTTRGRNNDLWACLDDGVDDDSLSDGCIRVATLNDLKAEWTGGIFDASGTRFFVSVQHNVTGHGVILEISGWH